MNKPDDISWLWRFLFTWRTAIGVIVCVLLAFLVTMPVVMKPVYESETIVYVPLTILTQQINQQGIGFANEHEVDSYIQILKSNTMADSLIKRFGLRENKGQNNSNLYKKLESRIKIEKTRYSSVSIKVRDQDPEKAAAMANSMIDLCEIIKQHLFYPNRLEALLYSKSLFEQKASEVAKLENELDSLEKHSSLPVLKNNWRYTKVMNIYKQELQELISRKNRYELAQKDCDTPLPRVYVISPAMATDKPEWPKRWLMCVLAAVGYLFIILVIEIIKRDTGKIQS